MTHSQGDASCVRDATDRLRALVERRRPDLLELFDRTVSVRVNGGLFSDDVAWISALDDVVRVLQRAGAGPVVREAMDVHACPSAYMTAARLGTLIPG